MASKKKKPAAKKITRSSETPDPLFTLDIEDGKYFSYNDFFKMSRVKQTSISNGYRIVKNLAAFPVDDLINNFILNVRNKSAMKLLRKYEYLLLFAKEHPKEYLDKRHLEHQALAKYILEGKLLPEWILLRAKLNLSEDATYVHELYLDEIDETWVYLREAGMLACGLETDGETIIRTSNPFTDILRVVNEKSTNRKTVELNLSPQQRFAVEEEPMVSNVLVSMMYVINEKTKICLPSKWFYAYSGILDPPRFYCSEDTLSFAELLEHRVTALPTNGICAHFINAGNIRYLTLIEDITLDGEFVLVFKITFDNLTEYCGFYLPTRRALYLSLPTRGDIHRPRDGASELARFILEVYADLTVGFPKDKMRKFSLQELATFTGSTTNTTNVLVEYEEIDPHNFDTAKRKHSSKSVQKPHRRKMSARTLPVGWIPSPDALRLAKHYGLELKEGQTFVSEYFVNSHPGEDVRRRLQGINVFDQQED